MNGRYRYGPLLGVLLACLVPVGPIFASGPTETMQTLLGRSSPAAEGPAPESPAPPAPETPPAESPPPAAPPGPEATPPMSPDEAPLAETDAPANGVTGCGPSPMHVITHCEAGSGFLCVNTPPGGVVDDQVVVTGLIDRANFPFAGLKVVVQHTETNMIQELPAETAVDADGAFAIEVPLTQLGAYTIILQALRAGGEPVMAQVAVSRVIAPNGKAAAVEMTPAPDVSGPVMASAVQLDLDLLPECERCDLIGSETGGVLISVVNTITTSQGALQQVERKTDIGVDGRFHLCIPVGLGENHLDIVACNAATGFVRPQCAVVPPVTFSAETGRPVITMHEPASAGTTISPVAPDEPLEIRFAVEGLTNGAMCEEQVEWRWNREPAVALCPAADGFYHVTLTPTTGINLGVIHVDDQDFPMEESIILGGGTVKSPWQGPGVTKADGALWERDALTVGLRQQLLTETLRTLLNHFLASDQSQQLIQQLVHRPVVSPQGSTGTAPVDSARAEALAAIRAEIPGCKTTGGLSDLQLEFVEPPEIGEMEVTQMRLVDDAVHLTVVASPRAGEKVALGMHVRLFRDGDRDGRPDGPVLPLKLGFRKLALYPRIQLQRHEPPIVLLTAETTNCDYQDPLYCTERPALLLPKNFVGSVTGSGGFVLCDHEDQLVSSSEAEGCADLNILNTQTGLLSGQVLDGLNEMLYCTGSSQLTYALREGGRHLRVRVGCGPFPPASPGEIEVVLPLWDCDAGILRDRQIDMPLGLDLVQRLMHLSDRGISLPMATRVGSASWYRQRPADVQRPTLGYLVDNDAPQMPADLGLAGSRDLFVGLSERLINQLLFFFAMAGDPSSGQGLLDWDLHEPFFRANGIDLTAVCDALDPMSPEAAAVSTLCQVRPRVKELLGSALTTYEYFPPNQPLMVRVRGSRTMVPHVRFFSAEVPEAIAEETTPTTYRTGTFIDLQVPDLALSFYALETDPAGAPDAYGNLPMLLDDAGAPRIHSLRPDLADPFDGPIVRATMTFLLPLELSPLLPDPEEPSQLRLMLRTNPALTRLQFRVAPGDNNTIIPDTSLLSNLREKLLTGLSLFASEEDAITLPIPKRLVMTPEDPTTSDDLLALLGVQEWRLAKEGLALAIDPGGDFLTMSANFHVVQQLVVGGEMVEWTIPEY
ncbi:MAG: hypothetical protein HYV02_04450 [Deltaproteobacteria bacterium]|nr:hypothetical protein [Deltaproteobacteria bacterium]